MNELTIKKEISPVIAQVENMSIACPADMFNATSILSQLNKFNDAMQEEKEKLTKPLNEAIKEVRARYKPTETLIIDAIASIKGKMGTYQQLALKVQQEAEMKIADRVSRGTLKVDTAIRKLGEMDTVEDKVKTDDGAVSFRTIRKFEVMDVVILANFEGGKYVEPNDTAIREAMKEGRELPGVRYYEEQSVVNKRN